MHTTNPNRGPLGPTETSPMLPLAIVRFLLIAPLLTIVLASAVLDDAAERARVVTVGTKAAVVGLAAFLLVQACTALLVQGRRRRDRRAGGVRP